jgi:hypothetical protein
MIPSRGVHSGVAYHVISRDMAKETGKTSHFLRVRFRDAFHRPTLLSTKQTLDIQNGTFILPFPNLNSSGFSRTNTPQVHADASNFATNITKEEAYKQVLEQAEALFEGQRNWVCPLSPVSPFLPPPILPHLTNFYFPRSGTSMTCNLLLSWGKDAEECDTVIWQTQLPYYGTHINPFLLLHQK